MFLYSSVICVGTDEMANNNILVYKLPELPNEDEVDVLSKDRELSILAAVSCEQSVHSIQTAPDKFTVRLNEST